MPRGSGCSTRRVRWRSGSSRSDPLLPSHRNAWAVERDAHPRASNWQVLKEMPHVDTVPVCSAAGNLGHDEAQNKLFRRPYIALALLLLSSPALAAGTDEVKV